MTMNPPTYTPGLGELIRANRLYIGLVARGMAKHLQLDRRDYQRIENGDDDCPPGLLDKIDALMIRFENEVDAVIDAAERHLGLVQQRADSRPGNNPPVKGRVRVQVSTDPRMEWERCVVNRAAIESGLILPATVVNT